jgi:hypothetical protein
MKRVVIVALVAALGMLATLIVGAAPADARTCPPSSVGGPTFAVIKIKGKKVPVKRITFYRGGPLDPPHTNQAAGISVRNASLTARRGVTVITWHVRWGPGCDGTLNAVTTMPLGSTFTIGKVGVTPRTYKITSRTTYPKGTIKRSWFSTTGRHRMVLLTCADLTGGVFKKTMAIFATPIPTPVPPPQAPAAPAADASLSPSAMTAR